MSSSSFTNLALRVRQPYSSALDSKQIDLEAENGHIGGFGSVITLSIARDDSRDILDFVFFLENQNVRFIHEDNIQKDNHSTRRQGSSMQVIPGEWQGNRVAIKTLRKTRLPDPAWKSTNPPEYLRLIQLHRQRQKDMLFEIQIMAREFFLNHRNIVKLFGIFFEEQELVVDEPNIFSPGMVLELADEQWPDLEVYLASGNRPDPISFDISAGLISDVADGVTALHSHGVIHADLKPANILIFFEDDDRTTPVAKIADFGFCAIMSSDENMRGGTSYWNAPEMEDGEALRSAAPYNMDPSGFYRDIYSFGLIAMNIALNGKLPLSEQTSIQLKIEDKVIEHVTNMLRNDLQTSQYTEIQLSKFIQIANSTLSRNKSTRLSKLTGIRHLLSPGICQRADEMPAFEPVPFSLMESVTHHEKDRYTRGYLFPTNIRCHESLPLSVIAKLDQVALNVNLDTAAGPVVAQCFYWAGARLDNIGDRAHYTRMAKLFSTASSLLQDHDRSNKPEFTAANKILRQISKQGFESDLARSFAEGIEEPSVLKQIRLGKLQEAEQYLRDEPSIIQSSMGPGWGCLHYASYYDRFGIMKLLLDCGSDVNALAGANLDCTPLAVASREGNINSVLTLIQLKAAIEPPFPGMHRVPIREAIMFSDDSKKYQETVSALLEAGASCEHGGYGTTPVHNAAHLPETLRILLNHSPGSVGRRDINKATPLHHSVRRRSTKAVEVLLSSNADVNAEDECGFTPLHTACRTVSKNHKLFHPRELEDVNATFAVGTEEDTWDIIALLRAAGADIDAPLFQGQYGMHLTADSFLYDKEQDFTEATVAFSEFTPATRDERHLTGLDISNEDRFTSIPLQPERLMLNCFHNSSNRATFGSLKGSAVMLPRKGSFEYEYILHDVVPNDYEFIVCLGRVDGNDYMLPDTISFRIFAEPIGRIDVIMGGYMKPLARICPESDTLYVVKFQEFELYARRDVRIVATVFTPSDGPQDQVIGGLVIRWIRIQRLDTDKDEFTRLSNARLPAEDIAAIKDSIS